MKLSIISDVHLTAKKDEAYRLFYHFLQEQLVVKPDYIIFLGDIFDLMAGSHQSYIDDYSELWEQIADLINNGISIIYFEGNHDLHLTHLFRILARKFNFDNHKLEVVRKDKIINDGSYSIYLSHGDELEGSPEYLKYKNFIHSRIMNFIANFIMPYRVLDFFGKRASSKSRGRNYLKYSSIDEMLKLRDRYRMIAHEIVKQYMCSHVFLGHSHCIDLYVDGFTYANCGYLVDEKKYILYDTGVVDFCDL